MKSSLQEFEEEGQDGITDGWNWVQRKVGWQILALSRKTVW